MAQPEKLFRRKATVTIAVPLKGKTLNVYGADVIEITDLRFAFKAKKTLGKEPNTLEVTITNLSEQSRAALQGKTLRVTVSAGYEGAQCVLFVGDSRHVDSRPEGADWTTVIQCGDGERGYKHGRVSESFRAGTSVVSILQKVADGMQLDSTQVAGVDGLHGRQYVAGYVAHGRASRELDKILKGFGYEWSIQDGKLQVLRPDAATAETVVVLDAGSGLVGSPTLNTPSPTQHLDPFTNKLVSSGGRPTLKAKSLLQPSIRPGRRVQIDSVVGIRGTFRVTEVTHTGDTSGGDFYTELEGVQA